MRSCSVNDYALKSHKSINTIYSTSLLYSSVFKFLSLSNPYHHWVKYEILINETTLEVVSVVDVVVIVVVVVVAEDVVDVVVIVVVVVVNRLFSAMVWAGLHRLQLYLQSSDTRSISH